MDSNYSGYKSEHLDLIAATSEIGLWELDLRSGVAERNLRHDQIFGYVSPLAHWSDKVFLSHVVPPDRERIGMLLQSAVAAGDHWSFETEILSAQGDQRWISAKGQPRFDEAGQMTHLIGHVLDITAQRRREERLKLISGELNHRVQNTISVVRAMVRISARSASDVAVFSSELDARLDAYARANRALTSDPAATIYLHQIIATELAIFGCDPERVTVECPHEISLEPRAAEAMTLVLHELLTNAAKHGALSDDVGRIEIIATRDVDYDLSLHWRESGGPAVSDPARRGFGSTLIASAVNGIGTLLQHFDSGGLRVDISLPYVRPDGRPQRSGNGAANAPRVLLVEDEAVIGMDLSMTLEESGYRVDGPHACVATAMEGLNILPDLALLNVQLGKETSAPVAERLRALGVPFVVLSGRTPEDGLPPEFDGAPVMQKPHRDSALLELLQQCLVNHKELNRISGT